MQRSHGWCHVPNRQPLVFWIKNSRGAILIEFAFAVPVLVIMLYFALDVPMAYRISAKLQKTSELYAHMLLNATRKKDIKAITITDLKDISKAIGLTFTGIVGNSEYQFFLSTYVICVKGIAKGALEVKWSVHLKNDLKNNIVTHEKNDYTYSLMNNSSSKLLGTLKDFVIEQDELKLLIEHVVWYTNGSRGFNKDFYLLTIPDITKGEAKTFGDRFAVVTPHDGLITETIN